MWWILCHLKLDGTHPCIHASCQIHAASYIYIAITGKAGSALHPTSYIHRTSYIIHHTSYIYPCIQVSVHPCIRVIRVIRVSVYQCIGVSVFPCIHAATLPNDRASIYKYSHNGEGWISIAARRCPTHNVIRMGMHTLEKVHWIIVFVFTLDCNNRIYCYDTEDGLVQQPSGWKSVAHWSVAMSPRMMDSPEHPEQWAIWSKFDTFHPVDCTCTGSLLEWFPELTLDK